MGSYRWTCAECGDLLTSIGPASLFNTIRDHEKTAHDDSFTTMESMLGSPRYERPAGSTPYDSKPIADKYTKPYGMCQVTPTAYDLDLLFAMRLSWSGDNRTEAELSGRYKPRNNPSA